MVSLDPKELAQRWARWADSARRANAERPLAEPLDPREIEMHRVGQLIVMRYHGRVAGIAVLHPEASGSSIGTISYAPWMEAVVPKRGRGQGRRLAQAPTGAQLRDIQRKRLRSEVKAEREAAMLSSPHAPR